MTTPEIRIFDPLDAEKIKRFPLAPSLGREILQAGPSYTFFVGDEVLACAGYMRENKFAWLILSTESIRYPKVFWQLRKMVQASARMEGKLYCTVRLDWPKAVRFAEWIGFHKTEVEIPQDNIVYCIMRI